MHSPAVSGGDGRLPTHRSSPRPVDRAHRGRAKINQRLCTIGGFDPDEWDLAPKPKWMRWSTYNRAVEKFDLYQDILDESLIKLAANPEQVLARIC